MAALPSDRRVQQVLKQAAGSMLAAAAALTLAAAPASSSMAPTYGRSDAVRQQQVLILTTDGSLKFMHFALSIVMRGLVSVIGAGRSQVRPSNDFLLHRTLHWPYRIRRSQTLRSCFASVT